MFPRPPKDKFVYCHDKYLRNPEFLPDVSGFLDFDD